MILYTIEIEGDFITFVGVADTPTEGKKLSHRKQLVQYLLTADDDFLTMVDIDAVPTNYDYKEVVDPDTGSVFISLLEFRTYILTQLAI